MTPGVLCLDQQAWAEPQQPSPLLGGVLGQCYQIWGIPPPLEAQCFPRKALSLPSAVPLHLFARLSETWADCDQDSSPPRMWGIAPLKTYPSSSHCSLPPQYRHRLALQPRCLLQCFPLPSWLPAREEGKDMSLPQPCPCSASTPRGAGTGFVATLQAGLSPLLQAGPLLGDSLAAGTMGPWAIPLF